MLLFLYTGRSSVFIVGFLIGVCLAVLLFRSEKEISTTTCCTSKYPSYADWALNMGIQKTPADYDEISYKASKNHTTRLTEAEFLRQHVSVTCVVYVSKEKNALAIKNTWGKHCDIIEFFSLLSGENVTLIQLRPKSSWHFLCDSIRHLWKRHKQKLQWSLFVSDDMFAIPENLRYYVAPYDFNKPHYFGHTLLFWNQLYNVGQAGYVLSKGAISALVAKFNSTESCHDGGKFWRNEDFYLGKHLGELGILPEDTRDDLGRGRFHGYNLNKLLFPGGISSLSSYYKKSIFPVPQGPECCSEHSITFNGIESDKLYTYDYFLYHTKVFRHGGSLGNQPASTPYPEEEVWRKFIRDEGLGEANLSARQFFELWERKVSSPDEFNRKVRQEYLHEEAPSGAAFVHMPDVLHSMLSSMQGNVSENVV